MRKLSPEFRLAAACCRWPPSAERDQQVRALATDVDWETFLSLVRRQRVEGLASDALRRSGAVLPEGVAAELGRVAAEIARQNLVFAAASSVIQRAFQAAGLTFLFVKGATLEKLAYGTLALKRARDIDMLIAPEGIEQACALLVEAGYQRVQPGPELDAGGFSRWVALCKETSWRQPTSGTIVELHTELVDNPDLLSGVGPRSSSQLVELGFGIRLPTLATDQLFAYLCVHGATHAWSRLKWIADLAALLSHCDSEEIERLYRGSLRLGAERCSAQALLLCHELLGAAVPEPLLVELRSAPVNRWLASLAVEVMAGHRSGSELDDTVLGTVPIHISHFLLARGWRYKSAELGRKLRNHHDQAHLLLPRSLAFLYPLIAVPSWIWRRIKGPAPLR